MRPGLLATTISATLIIGCAHDCGRSPPERKAAGTSASSAQPSPGSSPSHHPGPSLATAPAFEPQLATACSGTVVRGTVRAYVAGESIEERNRFVEAPFLPDGSLNERGGGEARNDNDEYGWALPMAARLRIRDRSLAMCFVGSSPWTDSNGGDYSGTWPSSSPGMTSSIAGTSIGSWLDEGDRERKLPGRRQELMQRKHCYDVAFASRGGNDLNNDVSDGEYLTSLVTLIKLLLDGSSCHAAHDPPAVYVTAHLPDRADLPSQERVFHKLTRSAYEQVRADASLPQNKRNRIHFVDMHGAFQANLPTRAFPKPKWFSGSGFDMSSIGHVGDSGHPRRLASIYAGEIAADALDLAELRALAGK